MSAYETFHVSLQRIHKINTSYINEDLNCTIDWFLNHIIAKCFFVQRKFISLIQNFRILPTKYVSSLERGLGGIHGTKQSFSCSHIELFQNENVACLLGLKIERGSLGSGPLFKWEYFIHHTSKTCHYSWLRGLDANEFCFHNDISAHQTFCQTIYVSKHVFLSCMP